MAIQPTCDMCDTELKGYGAILLSPPSKLSHVVKFHICKICYLALIKKNKISIKNTYKK